MNKFFLLMVFVFLLTVSAWLNTPPESISRKKRMLGNIIFSLTILVAIVMIIFFPVRI